MVQRLSSFNTLHSLNKNRTLLLIISTINKASGFQRRLKGLIKAKGNDGDTTGEMMKMLLQDVHLLLAFIIDQTTLLYTVYIIPFNIFCNEAHNSYTKVPVNYFSWLFITDLSSFAVFY